MDAVRGVGSLTAAVAGTGAGVGVGLAVESPFAVGATAAVVSLVVGYAVGHRGWIVFVTALSYVGVGTATLAGASGFGPPTLAESSMVSLQTGGALVGVGGAVALLFVLRWSTGNLKRLATRPVGAGVVRGAVATVADGLRGGRSLVRRLAGARPGGLPVGAFALVVLWGVVVGGSAVVGLSLSRGVLDVDAVVSLPYATARPVSALLAPVTLVPYLAGLLVPAYVATDWFALDGIADPPETYGVLARAAGRTPPSVEKTPTATTADSTAGASSSAGRSTRETGSASTDAATVDAGRSGVADGPSVVSSATDGGARPGTAASAPGSVDDGGHWPNAEDNPWTDDAATSAADGDTESSTTSDGHGTASRPGSATSDTGGAAPDETTDGGALSDDERVTFGDASARGPRDPSDDAPNAPDEGTADEDADETDVIVAGPVPDDASAPTDEDADETDVIVAGPVPDDASAPTDGDDATVAESSPAEGRTTPDEPDDATTSSAHVETTADETDPSTWMTPPDGRESVDESPSPTPSTDWETPPPSDDGDTTEDERPVESDDTPDDDPSVATGGRHDPTDDTVATGSSPADEDDTTVADGRDGTAEDGDGLETEVLDVDLPDIDTSRDRDSRDDRPPSIENAASGVTTFDDAEASESGERTSSPDATEVDGEDETTSPGGTATPDPGPDSDGSTTETGNGDRDSDSDSDADFDDGGVASTPDKGAATVGSDQSEVTAETKGDEPAETDDGRTGEQVADRVSRILDGELDAADLDLDLDLGSDALSPGDEMDDADATGSETSGEPD